MLTLERLGREFRSLPVLARAGLMALVLAGIADLAAHVEAAGHAGHFTEHTSAEIAAHVVAFAGMVLILLGVVVDGARQTRAHRQTVRRTRKGVA